MTDHGGFLGYQDGILWASGDDGAPVMPVEVRVCTRCGAVVVDEALHEVSHQQGVDSTL